MCSFILICTTIQDSRVENGGIVLKFDTYIASDCVPSRLTFQGHWPKIKITVSEKVTIWVIF